MYLAEDRVGILLSGLDVLCLPQRTVDSLLGTRLEAGRLMDSALRQVGVCRHRRAG